MNPGDIRQERANCPNGRRIRRPRRTGLRRPHGRADASGAIPGYSAATGVVFSPLMRTHSLDSGLSSL